MESDSPPIGAARRHAGGIALTLALVAVLAGGCAPSGTQGHEAGRPVDPRLVPFTQPADPSADDYRGLFGYFLDGFERHRSPLGALALYPGLPSKFPARVQALEGFSRFAPLMAAWIGAGRDPVVHLDGGSVNLVERLRDGLLQGTDPASPEYWGAIGDSDQRVVEAADVALAVWLSRRFVWDRFDVAGKARVSTWLGGAVDARNLPNSNWRLMVVVVGAVLEALGQPVDRATVARHWTRTRSFYRGGGWFSDGPEDRFDYYNAWGFHYLLWWLREAAPDHDREFVDAARGDFVASYKHLFGPRGLPIRGRSVCYRMAAPAPLILAQSADPDRVSPGQARRALDLTWRYFVSHGAVRDGTVTQGYCGPDPRILDNYSGPASCLWSLRSLVAAFHQPDDAPFWQAEPEPLPVERGAFTLDVPAAGWRIVGEPGGDVVVEQVGVREDDAPLDDYTSLHRLWDGLRGLPSRPTNLAAKYSRRRYRASEPFCGCLP